MAPASNAGIDLESGSHIQCGFARINDFLAVDVSLR